MEEATRARGEAASDATSCLLSWTTEGIPERQRLEFWTDAVSSALFEMDMATAVTRGFKSFVEAMPLDAIVVSALGGSQREAIRSNQYISRANQYSFHILVDYAKPWFLNWRGNLVRLEPGDIALSDTRFVHSGIYPQESVTARHNLKLSPQWLGTWLQSPEKMTGLRISGQAGWGRALSAYVAQLTPRLAMAPPLPAKLIADQLGALLGLVEAEIFSTRPSQQSELQLASKVMDVIRQRANEIALTAPAVALSLGISERTLHRHLKSVGNTFSNILQESRIDSAKRMLESVHLRLLTTAEIGFRSGFGDPSHFVRVMHRRLGQSPGNYRKAFMRG